MSDSLRSMAPIVLAFALLMGLMAWGFDSVLERRHNPNLELASGATGPQRVVLERNAAGRYVAPGRINGQSVTFLIDTGADHVAVPGGVARRIGLDRGARIPVGTAGGTVSAYATEMASVTLGGIRLNNVWGSINPAMRGEEVLLGMTFLRHVDFSQRGTQLIIEAPGADPR